MCGVFLLYFASSHARVHFSLYVLNNHNVQHIVSFFRVNWGFFPSFCGNMCAGFLPVQEFCNVPDRILADWFYQPDLIGDLLTSLPLNTSLPVSQRKQNKNVKRDCELVYYCWIEGKILLLGLLLLFRAYTKRIATGLYGLKICVWTLAVSI